MNGSDLGHGRRAAVASLVVLAVFGLVACRGGERMAAPPATIPPAAPTTLPAPRGSSGPARSADPLADVEAGVDAVARDLDADAAAAGGR